MLLRILLRTVGLALFLGLLTDMAHPQTGEKSERPSLPRLEARKIELHKIGNEELLKQSQLVLERAGASYLAQLRELATVELALDRARKATDGLVIPPEEPGTPPGDSLTVAKTALDRARGRLDALKKRLELVRTEKTLSERMVGTVDACGSAALAFSNLLDDLNAFVIEINLRVKDRTLPPDAVPKTLEPEALGQRKRELTTEQEQWKQKGLNAQKELEAAGKRTEAAKKLVLEAEVRFGQATRKHAQEVRQKEVEKEYTGRSVSDLMTEVLSLHEEEAGLIGAFNLALQRFRTREAEATQRRQALEALKAPESKAGGRSEDVSSAIASAQAAQQYFAKRVEALEGLEAALQAMLEQGSIAEGEGAVLNEHLFKIQVVVRTLEKTAQKEPVKTPLPRSLESAVIQTRVKALTDASGAALASLEKARLERTELTPRIKEARTAQEETSRRLTDLKQTQEAGKRVAEFEKNLRAKNAAQVLAEFNRAAKELDEKLPLLAKQAEDYGRTRERTEDLRRKREAVKDPFMRLAEAESQAEKQKLLDELNKQAGLDRVPRDGTSMGGMMGRPSEMEGGMLSEMMAKTPPEPRRGEDRSAEKETRKEKEKEQVDPLSMQGFQKMLATRARAAEERDQLGGQLLDALKELAKSGEAYSASLSDVREVALQRYAAAVDLKKRLGRGELKSEEVPEGITAALKREELSKLETTASGLVTAQAQIRQEEEQLGRPDRVRDDLNRAMKEMLTLASQRLDLLADLRRLEAEYKRDRKELSESEVKRIEQEAVDRVSKEDTWLETILSIDSSAPAKSLVEVLQTFYREAITVEEKQDLLVKQKEKADRLVELARQESTLLVQAQPLVREYLRQLERRREEETLLVRARLKPEEADELLRGYQVKTGKQLPRPLPVAEKDRPAAVQEANTILYERLLAVEAARRWVRLIEGRLSPQGLPAETGAYQDQLGTLEATYGTNFRRLQALGGKVEASTAFAALEVPEGTANPSEIARVRNDLFHVRRDGILWILGKIALVLVLAWLIPRVVMAMLRRAATFTEKGRAAAHGKLVMAFLQAFLKLIVYTTALVLILSFLGFDITAILAGLGIGGLAIGLAAQHAISDILGGLIIFLERPFSIGDTVKIGESEAAQVVGLTWRITQLRDPDGVAINIPNRQVTETSIVNLTREGGKTYDSVPILVPAVYPVPDVVSWIQEALAQCKIPLPQAERGVDVEELSVSMMGTYYVRYMPFYFLKELAQRDDARGEVFAHVTAMLTQKGVVVAPTSGEINN